MIQSIQALREQRNALAKTARDFLEAHNDDWSAEHSETYDNHMSELDSIDAKMSRVTDLHERMASDALESQVQDAADRAEHNGTQGGKLFAKWLRQGDAAISASEWVAIRATMSTTTGSEGGFSVQKDVAQVIVDALKATGGMRDVATILTTETGNPIDYPNSDGTSEEGEILAENASAANADPVLGVTSLLTYKYSSKAVAVPIELLMDSAVDIEAFVRTRLVDRTARISNKHFTVGTGSGQPRGAVTAASSGKVGTTGQTATVTYDDLVDLQHSVNRAYRERGAVFMMSDSAIKVVRKIKDTTGRPIFAPGYEAGSPGGSPDTILGSRLIVNDDIPAMAADAKSILFGDFSQYIIRDVMAMTLLRMTDSAYSKKGQVGFLMLSRHGGNYVDVGGGLKYYQNSAT